MKCRECEFASVHTYPRNGNSNSAHVGHFGQEASYCNHPKCPTWALLLFPLRGYVWTDANSHSRHFMSVPPNSTTLVSHRREWAF